MNLKLFFAPESVIGVAVGFYHLVVIPTQEESDRCIREWHEDSRTCVPDSSCVGMTSNRDGKCIFSNRFIHFRQSQQANLYDKLFQESIELVRIL
jgi:hypothetical protein